MNNRKIGLSLAALIVVSLGFYFFFLNKSSKDLSNYIPKEVLLVSKVDLLKMGQKINFKDLVDFKIFKALSRENDGSMEKVLQNPLETGIAFQKTPYFFVTNAEKDELKPLFCFIFGISDKDKFLKFFKSNTDNDFDIKNEDNYTSIDYKKAKMFVNDNFSIFIASADENDINFKKIYNNFLELKDEQNINSNQSFINFQKNESDLNVFLNKKSIENLVDQESSRLTSDEKQMVNKLVEVYPIGATLSFDEDVLRLKYFSDSENKNSEQFLQNSGLNSNDLQMIDPDGKPLSYLSLNADLPKILALFKDNNEFEKEVEDFSVQLGLTKEDLLTLFDGKMSLSLIDIKPGVEQIYNDYTSERSPNPIFLIHAGIRNTSACQSILEKLQSDNVVFKDGIYSILYDSYNQQSVHFILKGNDFILSNSIINISDIRDGRNWSALKESSGSDLASKNPFSMYLDLKLDTYNDIIDKFASSSEKGVLKELLKNMNNVVGYGNQKETTLELRLKPQNKNSLWYLLTIAEDVYKKVS